MIHTSMSNCGKHRCHTHSHLRPHHPPAVSRRAHHYSSTTWTSSTGAHRPILQGLTFPRPLPLTRRRRQASAVPRTNHQRLAANQDRTARPARSGRRAQRLRRFPSHQRAHLPKPKGRDVCREARPSTQVSLHVSRQRPRSCC